MTPGTGPHPARTPVEPSPQARVQAQRRALAAVLARASLSLESLWLDDFALGGSAGLVEVEGYLHSAVDLPDLERDLLAMAADARMDELAGALRVPYTRPVRHPCPPEGTLAALVELLLQAPAALGGDLPSAVAAAGRALGVQPTVHLVDYERRHLVPLLSRGTPGGGRPRRAPLAVEGTLAGRAFRTGTTQVALGDDQPRLWVPILDSAERLGVLDVVLGARSDLHDPWLREQCEWLGRMLGHLAYRAARRDGRDLYDQAAAIDEVLTAHFSDALAMATGVLATLDLGSGRLRYLAAGHPAPLVLREGRVVTTLEGGRFGLDRLVDLLERAAAAQQPAPETVRRLVSAVLDHQQGVLQDDATVLLASWGTR